VSAHAHGHPRFLYNLIITVAEFTSPQKDFFSQIERLLFPTRKMSSLSTSRPLALLLSLLLIEPCTHPSSRSYFLSFFPYFFRSLTRFCSLCAPPLHSHHILWWDSLPLDILPTNTIPLLSCPTPTEHVTHEPKLQVHVRLFMLTRLGGCVLTTHPHTHTPTHSY